MDGETLLLASPGRRTQLLPCMGTREVSGKLSHSVSQSLGHKRGISTSTHLSLCSRRFPSGASPKDPSQLLPVWAKERLPKPCSVCLFSFSGAHQAVPAANICDGAPGRQHGRGGGRGREQVARAGSPRGTPQLLPLLLPLCRPDPALPHWMGKP